MEEINKEIGNSRTLDKVLYCSIFLGLFMIVFTIVSNIYVQNDTYALVMIMVSLGLVIIPIILGMIYGEDLTKKIKENTKNDLLELGYSMEDVLFKYNELEGLVLNEDTNHVVHLFRKTVNDKFHHQDIPFNSILDVTISSNNSTVTSTSKGGLVGGALVGGVLAGGFGSVIGAMGASKISTEQVKDLDLVITIDNLKNPLIRIETVEPVLGIRKSSDKYDKTIKSLDEWFGKFTIIMKRNEKLNNMI